MTTVTSPLVRSPWAPMPAERCGPHAFRTLLHWAHLVTLKAPPRRFVVSHPPNLRRDPLMSDVPHHEPHARPHTGPMAAPFLEFDLPAEIHRLKAETTWSTGQNARTLVKYDDLRVVLIALRANARMPEHKTEGTDLDPPGHIQVKAAGRTFSLRPGGLLALDQGLPHDVEAMEESVWLLTIAWPFKG